MLTRRRSMDHSQLKTAHRKLRTRELASRSLRLQNLLCNRRPNVSFLIHFSLFNSSRVELKRLMKSECRLKIFGKKNDQRGDNRTAVSCPTTMSADGSLNSLMRFSMVLQTCALTSSWSVEEISPSFRASLESPMVFPTQF
jgi:hypothetical protein